MRVGVDFDNTIVCYDALFSEHARRLGLVPVALPATKAAVRDYLRKVGNEDAWVALQGEVYGRHIDAAVPFLGVIEALTALVAAGATLFIVSHKTATPRGGEAHDLHDAARRWLSQYRIAGAGGVVSTEHVYFEETRALKLKRIAALQCSHFIDDLPEVLREPAFPEQTKRILFSPHAENCAPHPDYHTVRAWSEIVTLLLPNGSER